jgi:hypothetical protein
VVKRRAYNRVKLIVIVLSFLAAVLIADAMELTNHP